jgi:uncharacterized membrane protein
MRTAWEKFQGATRALARSGSIKERLETAYRYHVAFVLEEELPKENRDELRALHIAVNRERPISRAEDSVRATIRKMSNDDADLIAEVIVRIFSAMPRSQPMLVRSSGPAQVIPLHVAEDPDETDSLAEDLEADAVASQSRTNRA